MLKTVIPILQVRKLRHREVICPRLHVQWMSLGVKFAPTPFSYSITGGGVWGQSSQIQKTLVRELLVFC